MTYLLPYVNRITPYPKSERIPEDGVVLKLDQNESPYPPSPKVLEVLSNMAENRIRHYPDPSAILLRNRLAEIHGIPPEQILCGNGTSELITLLFRACIGTGTVAAADPSFALYPLAAQLAGAHCVKIPLREDNTLDIGAMAASGADALVVVNPNAPTGILTERAELEELASSFRGLVIVDEAYMEYVDGERESMLPLLQSFSNVVVLRTFSKAYALSGIRVGSVFASAAVIEGLGKVKELYNLGAVSQQLALAALDDQDYMKMNVRKTKQTRDLFSSSLKNLGFQVLPSETNFVLCEPSAFSPWLTAQRIHRLLQEHHIYVRYFTAPPLHTKLRISIGTDEQMDYVLRTIAKLEALYSAN
ncbi:histidinol-phosphate transaminase [Paenibacillus senegalensis]|uniref:histidinol-phosphate transaminase n=1 Tax=Paenibacillus senegalensis TaxID=1465766 RepID=UPI000288DBDE|nr:histidinol-phosphate transaminase [Paenibacillus senegalensis]